MEEFSYVRSKNEVLVDLGTTLDGLTENEVIKRATTFGKNTLVKESHFRGFKIFLKQFNNILIYVLLAAAFLSLFLDHKIEFYAIIFIAALTVILSFLQEFSADRTIRAISKLAGKKITVRRQGKEHIIPVEELVPGDIVLLTRGVIIPADLRIVESRTLTIDESILTGESQQKVKITDPLQHQDIPLADQDNMAFSGTAVTSGSGIGVVVTTGLETEIGKITKTIKELGDQKSPLQHKIEQMSKQVSFVVLAIAACLLSILLILGQDFGISLLLVGSVIVAGIPESFPLSLTLALSKGVKRMARKNAVVKNLNSVETLGTTTVICTDKTGTLTQNRMFVEKIHFADGFEIDVGGRAYEPSNTFSNNKKQVKAKKLQAYNQFFHACTLCNDAQLHEHDGEWKLKGEPTEGALLTLAKSVSFDEEVLREKFSRIDQIPFDPKNKFMITLHHNAKLKSNVSYLKGAAENVLGQCTRYRSKSGLKTISKTQRQHFHKVIDQFTANGLRVLAIASKETREKSPKEHRFVFEGFVGIEDPLRDDVFDAVTQCEHAGINVVMITGDHKSTAQHIANQLGLIRDQRSAIVEGYELDKLNDEELDQLIDSVAVFARTTPEHKFRIVSSLQRKGHIVAMTGDGVNDAPALKKADIGVAMGQNGTEVAREAGDMILKDDNFSTIVHAVREGRTIYSNIRRFVYYLLTGNVSQVGIIFLAVILGLSAQLPLTPLMILYINFITSTFPALALSIEPTHEKVMRQKPRDTKEKILSPYIISKILIIAPSMLFAAMIIYLWELQVAGSTLQTAMTSAFAVMVLSGLFHTFNARKLHTTIFDKEFFRNPWVFVSVISSLIITLLILHMPFGQTLFGTVPLDISDWAVIIFFSAIIVLFSEIIKLSIRQEFIEQKHLKGLKAKLE